MYALILVKTSDGEVYIFDKVVGYSETKDLLTIVRKMDKGTSATKLNMAYIVKYTIETINNKEETNNG